MPKQILARFALGIAVFLLTGCASPGNTSLRSSGAVAESASAVVSHPAATPTATIEQQVSAAYLAYWDAYGAALLNLDISKVQGFASGDELQRISDEIDMLRANGVAMRVVVKHDFSVSTVSDTQAGVVDRYVNNSFYVDPTTKDPPTGSGSGDVLQDSFVLERLGGRWVVTQSSRQR